MAPLFESVLSMPRSMIWTLMAILDFLTKEAPFFMVTHLSLAQEDPLGKEMVIQARTLAWRIWTERSLVGYSPWGRRELDTTEWLPFPSLHLLYVDGCLLYTDWWLVHISWQALKSYFTVTQPLVNGLISSESPSCSKRYFPIIVCWLLPFWWKVSENQNHRC